MPFPKKEKFLMDVLSCVKFPFDRDAIKSELENHIADKMEYYLSQGYDMDTAEDLSIRDMGDAREIGHELNREHNPLLGWLWKITNVLVTLFAIWNGFFIGSILISSMFVYNPIKSIPKSNIVYTIDVNQKVRLDDTIMNFTKVVYDKNGDLHIAYEYYSTKLWGTGWSSAGIGKVMDNLGNEYFAASGGGGGGLISKYTHTVKDFSKDADTLILSYDFYNRKYKLEIPLKAGGNNE